MYTLNFYNFVMPVNDKAVLKTSKVIKNLKILVVALRAFKNAHVM